MNCDAIRRELAVPNGSIPGADLAQHLAACGPCAAHAESLERLDDAWAATRPAVPGPLTWEGMWARVQDAPAPAPAAGHSRVAALWACAAMAQAAAVLLAFWVFFRQSPAPSAGPAPAPALAAASQPVQVEYELDQGQTLFLVLDARGGTVVVKPRFVSTEELVAFDGEGPDPYASAYQMTFVMLNAMEGME
jgi:hypothetical protein